MIYENIFNQLQSKGYYLGTFDDFWHDDHGVTKEEFYHAIELFKDTSKNMDQYMYRHNYIDQNNKIYLNDPNYTGPIPTQEDIDQAVIWPRRQIRKDFVKNAIEGGADIRTTQQWAFIGGGAMSETFNTFTKNYISKIYKFLESYKNNLYLAPQYSIYHKGDFSETHYDKPHGNRACVIIFYFGDPLTYKNPESGGRLIVCKNQEYRDLIHNNPTFMNKLISENNPLIDYAIPTLGNYVILDFTNHDLGHAIEIVKDNFVRFALQIFVSPTKPE